jgi:hypothetical protein
MKLDGLEKVDYGLINIAAIDKDFGYDIFKVVAAGVDAHKYEVVLTDIDAMSGMSLTNSFEAVMEAIFDYKLTKAMPSDIVWFLNELRPTMISKSTYPVRKGKFKGHKFDLDGIDEKSVQFMPEEFMDYNKLFLLDAEMRELYAKPFVNGSKVSYKNEEDCIYTGRDHLEKLDGNLLYDLEVVGANGDKILVEGKYSLAPGSEKSDVFEIEVDRLVSGH